ncbi:MAG TPA: GspE/PulE family protein [Gaiellaceae bacterium]|nr:GspE/PulE family protein [Gaiellaceae bacterium]
MSNVHPLHTPHDSDLYTDLEAEAAGLNGQGLNGHEPPLDEQSEIAAPPAGFRRRASDEENEELNDLDRARQLAESHGLPLVDLAVTGISPEATKLVPLAVLERVGAIPYSVDENSLRIALTDPDNVNGIDELRLVSRLPVEFAVAPLEDVMVEVRRLTRANVAFAAVLGEEGLEAIDDEADDLTADDGISEGPIVRLVNSIVFQAAEDGASDIHLEPQEDGLLVRFRVDGVLVIAQRIPRQLAVGVVTRLKVLAKLDIAERRKPQDGRLTLGAGAAGRQLDIRVATLPTVYGESVVMRLLDKSKKAPTLESLGLSAGMHAQLAQLVKRPTGAVLVTGPTGSGKSTTLYAALAGINKEDINVITVEDPVEYRLAGINQVQINQRAGLTFATVLRSILRSDPDVIMVGEIRDVETAKISIEAALTGHLVLSTLHTNDAPSAITRLSEMGVEPFLTASAVTAVLAQRLMRKLCSSCAEPYQPSEEELLAARISPDEMDSFRNAEFKHKVGCTRCSNTGYKGRIGVFQLLEMTEKLASLAARRANKDEIERAASEERMRTLWADGIEKVAGGFTTVEELARVVF